MWEQVPHSTGSRFVTESSPTSTKAGLSPSLVAHQKACRMIETRPLILRQLTRLRSIIELRHSFSLKGLNSTAFSSPRRSRATSRAGSFVPRCSGDKLPDKERP